MPDSLYSSYSLNSLYSSVCSLNERRGCFNRDKDVKSGNQRCRYKGVSLSVSEIIAEVYWVDAGRGEQTDCSVTSSGGARITRIDRRLFAPNADLETERRARH